MLGSYSRTIALVLALIGNLLPTVGGVSLAVVGLLFATILLAFELIRYLPVIHPVIYYDIALFGLLSMSVLWTDAPNEYGKEKLFKLLTSTLVTTLLAALIKNKFDLETLATVWPVLVLPIALAAILGFEGGRATGFDSNPIWLARALATGVLFIAWRLWYTGNQLSLTNRAMYGCLGLTLVVGILLSGSRGPLLGLLLALTLMVTLSNVTKSIRVVMLTYAAIISIGGLALSGAFSTSRLLSTDSSLRSDLYETALEIISRTPGGIGMGNIGEYWDSHQNYPHNMFLEVLAEHGWIVGTIFLFFVFNTLIRILRRTRKHRHYMIVGMLLVAELVNVNVSGDLNARTFFLFLMLALWVMYINDVRGEDAFNGKKESAVGVHTSILKDFA